jgi:hypothetical protein
MRAAHANRNDGNGEIAAVARLVVVDPPVGEGGKQGGDKLREGLLFQGPASRLENHFVVELLRHRVNVMARRGVKVPLDHISGVRTPGFHGYSYARTLGMMRLGSPGGSKT